MSNRGTIRLTIMPGLFVRNINVHCYNAGTYPRTAEPLIVGPAKSKSQSQFKLR